MDDRVLSSDRADQHVTDGRFAVRRYASGIVTKRWQIAGTDQITDRGLNQNNRGWVCRQESGQVLRIQMVWMLVCYEHRIKISQGVPGVGNVPGIDQNPSAIGLGEDSRMPKVGDPHVPNRKADR
jgi:hypothetical protein